jgi:hypothetical protein
VNALKLPPLAPALNWSVSTVPEMPATEPLPEFCHIKKLDHPLGKVGHETDQFATQSG